MFRSPNPLMGNTQSSVTCMETEHISPVLPSTIQLQQCRSTPSTGLHNVDEEIRIYIRKSLLGSTKKLDTAKNDQVLHQSSYRTLDRKSSNVHTAKGIHMQSDVEETLSAIDQLRQMASPCCLAFLHKFILDTAMDVTSSTLAARSHHTPTPDSNPETSNNIRQQCRKAISMITQTEEKIISALLTLLKKRHAQNRASEKFNSAQSPHYAQLESEMVEETDLPRSETPAVSPGYLGMQVGSLRITNGTASPEVFDDAEPESRCNGSKRLEEVSSAQRYSDVSLLRAPHFDHYDHDTSNRPASQGLYQVQYRASSESENLDLEPGVRAPFQAWPARLPSALDPYVSEMLSNPFLTSSVDSADADGASSCSSGETGAAGRDILQRTRSPFDQEGHPAWSGRRLMDAQGDLIYPSCFPSPALEFDSSCLPPATRSRVEPENSLAACSVHTGVPNRRPQGPRPAPFVQYSRARTVISLADSIAAAKGEPNMDLSLSIEPGAPLTTEGLRDTELDTTSSIEQAYEQASSQQEVAKEDSSNARVECHFGTSKRPTDSDAKAKHKPKKLRKRQQPSGLAFSLPTLDSSYSAPPNAEVPKIPQELASRYTHRMSQNPARWSLYLTACPRLVPLSGHIGS